MEVCTFSLPRRSIAVERKHYQAVRHRRRSERRKFVDNRREHTYTRTCHTGVDGLKHWIRLMRERRKLNNDDISCKVYVHTHTIDATSRRMVLRTMFILITDREINSIVDLPALRRREKVNRWHMKEPSLTLCHTSSSSSSLQPVVRLFSLSLPRLL